MLTESAKRAIALAESTGACRNYELVLRILEKHGCFAQQTQQAVLAQAQPVTPTAVEKAAKGPRKASKVKPWDLQRILSTLVKGFHSFAKNGPILSCVKIDGKRIQATDYDIVIEIDCPEVLGHGCFPAAGLPKEYDGLTFAPDGKTVSAGCATLDTWPIEDFPRIQKDPLDTYAKAGRLNLADLRIVSAAMSDDPARMNLNGVLLEKDGDLVATDGHRMMIATGGDSRPENRIPHRAWIKAVLTWFSDLETLPLWFSMGEVVTQVQCGAYTVRVFGRCIGEEFPNYRGVIPNNCPVNVTVLGSTIDKVRHLGRVKNHHEDPLIITRAGIAYDYRGKQLERVAWSVPEAGLDSMPDTLRIGLNRRFVEDLPDCESWSVGIVGTDTPTAWKSGRVTAVLMSMDLPE